MSEKATHRVKHGTIYVGTRTLETGDLIAPTPQQLAAFGDKLEPVPAAPEPEKGRDPKSDKKEGK